MNNILQDYNSYLCGKYIKHNTCKNKLCAIRILLQHTKNNINPVSIQKFYKWANQHYSHNSLNNKINAWNEFLKWNNHPEYKRKHIGFIETRQPVLSEHEIEKILQKAKNNPETYLMIRLSFIHELRTREIINIKISDIDYKNKSLTLLDTKTGNRDTPLSDKTITAIQNYLKVRPRPKKEYKSYLFICNNSWNKRGKYKSCKSVVYKFKKLAHQCQLGIVIPQTIRRTGFTLKQDMDSKYFMGDVKKVQRIAGHRDPRTTLRYNVVSDKSIYNYFDRIDGLDKQQNLDLQEANGLDKPYKDFPQNILNLQNEKDQQHNDNSNCSFSFSFSFYTTTNYKKPDKKLITERGWQIEHYMFL